MLLIKNKRGLFDNEILEKYTAGIELRGYEVKAIREHNVNFEGSYIKVEKGSVFLNNLHVGKYSKQSQEYSEMQAKRPRRLLLNKNEIHKLERAIAEKGKTALPAAFVVEHGLIKLEFVVVRGRKKHEQKQLLKKRQIEIDLRKDFKNREFSL